MSVVVVGVVSFVQATGMGEVVPTTPMRSKATIFYTLLAIGGATVGLRCRRERMSYFLAAERYEDRRIRAGETEDKENETLHRVRQTSWSQRAGRSSTYSSISLGLIIVVALLFVANRTEVNEQGVGALFVWVILIASVSVVLYGVSLQLWDEALGDGYAVEEVIALRNNALVLSSLGWITLVSALGLAVITVHSPLGTVIGASGVVAGLYVFEHKWRLARLQTDPELRGGIFQYAARVKSGGPVVPLLAEDDTSTQ